MELSNQHVKGTVLYQKTLGSLLGGLIGDAIGTPTESKSYAEIESAYGWVTDFTCDGTDDTVMKNLLAEALIRTGGYATADDWAQTWLDKWDMIFGDKFAKFFISVINTAQKIKRYSTPRMAALGNLPSSSSAMCISPVGIVNACNPTQAALQAYSLASLIHTHDVAFCQDGAACMAAAVAEAMNPQANVDSIIKASLAAIVPISGKDMIDRITTVLAMARAAGEYKAFRSAVYARADELFMRIQCDSRETIPLTVGLFWLAQGDVEKCVVYAANFGRDTDTIGSMAGAIAGALHGVQGIKSSWVEKAQEVTKVNQQDMAVSLVRVALAKHEREQAAAAVFDKIV